MNVRWLWRDYIDPQLSLTPKERKQVRARVIQIVFGASAAQHRQMLSESIGTAIPLRLLAVVEAMVPGTLMCLIMLPMIVFRIRIVGWMVLGLFAYILAMWVVMAFLGRYTRRPAVNMALRELGYDVCLRCGYWLRGLDDAVKNCPECGKEREPRANTLVEESPP